MVTTPPQSHPALDWLARRRAGESAALIAHRAGVSQETVERATKPYGPFPRASQHLGRTQLSDEALSERERRWVEARRRGVLAVDIGAAEGVRHQIISRATVEHGPFPAVDVVEEWVEARRPGGHWRPSPSRPAYAKEWCASRPDPMDRLGRRVTVPLKGSRLSRASRAA